MRTRESRRHVLLPARMRIQGVWVDVSIRNISSKGMLIHSRYPIARGTYVEIRRDIHTVIGRAQWNSGEFFGVLAQDRLDIDAIAAKPGTSAERRPDGRAERRRDPRDPAQIVARSHALGRRLQFAVICMVLVGTVALAAHGVHTLLEQPLTAVGDALAGQR